VVQKLLHQRRHREQARPAGPGRFRVSPHVVGNFPGGEVDLNCAFGVRGGLITSLSIAE
jgi:hypothetical protein